ncbi:efflux RND transporter periplasmic adaptor subunit [Paenibacillus kobensis]|uniref:efflux RND transporter periplasmic adaptor subunit n=1 Tax=Paenibacillus kobensis TaxID=59841 RepID=UPI0038990065
MYRRQRTKPPLSKWTVTAKYALVLLTASAALAGCSLLPREPEVLQPPLVEPALEQFDVVPVTRGDIQTSLKGTAYFVSSNAAPLSFKESGGRVKAIAVTAGEEVKAGDLLAELETGDLEFQVRLQRLNVERTKLLYKQALAADASSTDIRLREIDLEREQMSLDAMQGRLDKSRLFAPISGTVTFVENLNAGDTVNAYQSIVTIADPSNLKLTYVAADSKELFAVKTGMPVILKYKGSNYTGEVVQSPSNIPAAADNKKAENNAVTVYMSMDNPPDGIHVGDSADLTIELQKRENVIVLPRSALRSYMGRSYVQIAEGERRKEVDIEVGLSTPTAVEIVKGLEEGQQVILSN